MTTDEFLIESGRQIATGMIMNAVKKSESPEEASHQLFVLRVAAAHIFACCAFNEEQDGEVEGWHCLEQFFNMARQEYVHMVNQFELGEVKLYGPRPH